MTLMCREIREPYAEGVDRLWQVSQVLFEAKTPYQEVLIGRTQQGISLFCNNERQSTEYSQVLYHEGQWFPAHLLVPNPKRVLVIGSSEGVVPLWAVEAGANEVVHVDIDPTCVSACAQFLPYGYTLSQIESASHGKGPLKLLYQDGYKYVEEALNKNESFDIIVMDLPDETVTELEAQQNRLYQSDFLFKIKALLSPEGVFITQAGCPTLWRNAAIKACLKRMVAVFPTCRVFDLDEHDWTWAIGTKALFDVEARMIEGLNQVPKKPQYIDELLIKKALIPPFSLRGVL